MEWWNGENRLVVGGERWESSKLRWRRSRGEAAEHAAKHSSDSAATNGSNSLPAWDAGSTGESNQRPNSGLPRARCNLLLNQLSGGSHVEGFFLAITTAIPPSAKLQ